MNLWKILFSGLGIFIFIGTDRVIAQIEPTPQPGIHRDLDLVYEHVDGSNEALDLIRPISGTGPFPVVVFIHGGAWSGGTRQDFLPMAQAVAQHGYIGVTVSYRLVPTHWPAQIEDVKTAVRWLRAHATQYQIDSNRMAAVGFSAGGHLACLLGVTRPEDKLEGTDNLDQSSAVQAVVSNYGPTDFQVNNESEVQKDILTKFLGGTPNEIPNAYRLASPITYVHAGAPPFLFIQGADDTLVPPLQSQEMAAKLQSVGSEAKVILFPGEGHGFKSPDYLIALRDTLDFLNTHLKR